MPFALLFALLVGAAIPNIAIEQTAKGYVARVATFDMRQQNGIDAEIERRAAQLCKTKEIRWGQFSSVAAVGSNPAAEPAPVTGYSKEFSCVEPSTASYSAAPANWQATSADEKDAISFFDSYYSKRDRGDFADALAMFQPEVVSDPENWSKEAAAQNKKIGAGKREVTGVTWYVNPETAPHPGVYVAIDFVGEFPQTYFYCGYVVLYRRAAGSYELTREEQNMFAHGDGTADQRQIERMRASMCRE
jgi:hypothetical protein